MLGFKCNFLKKINWKPKLTLPVTWFPEFPLIRAACRRDTSEKKNECPSQKDSCFLIYRPIYWHSLKSNKSTLLSQLWLWLLHLQPLGLANLFMSLQRVPQTRESAKMRSPFFGPSSTVKETRYFLIQFFRLIIWLLYISLQMFPCSQKSLF